MCDCGCKVENIPDCGSCLNDFVGNCQEGTNRSVNAAGSFINAKRVLTYDDETDHMGNDRSRCPQNVSMGPHPRPQRTGNDSLERIRDLLNSTGTRGIAVVQRQTPQANTGRDCPGAAPQKESNMRLIKKKKYRLGTPPCANTPCAPVQKKLQKACLPLPECWQKYERCERKCPDPVPDKCQ